MKARKLLRRNELQGKVSTFFFYLAMSVDKMTATRKKNVAQASQDEDIYASD